MSSYKFLVLPSCQKSMQELKHYIADVLCNPSAAYSCIDEIERKIVGLADMPKMFKLVDDEPWHSRGIRRMRVRNFFVYYRVDDSANMVYVLNITYAKRSQKKALDETDIY